MLIFSFSYIDEAEPVATYIFYFIVELELLNTPPYSTSCCSPRSVLPLSLLFPHRLHGQISYNTRVFAHMLDISYGGQSPYSWCFALQLRGCIIIIHPGVRH